MNLAQKTLEIATTFIGTREHPRGSNRGPEIDMWVKQGGGLDQPTHGNGYPYCASFISYCVYKAISVVGGPAQFKGGASVLKLRDKNPNLIIYYPLSNEPCIGLLLHPSGSGHAWLVDPQGGLEPSYTTVEANTGPGPAATPEEDREGDGVWKRHDRKPFGASCYLRIG